MIEKIETALILQFNSKYIKLTIKIYQAKINAICNAIYSQLIGIIVSHVKTLQGLSNKW